MSLTIHTPKADHQRPRGLNQVIVWLNGGFGAGKTTVARALARHWPDAHLFDPEQIGFMLRRVMPEAAWPDDFQSLSLWRRLTVDIAMDLVGRVRGPLLVPMTLVNPRYFREVVGGLRRAGLEVHHFALITSPSVLRERLRRRRASAASKAWTLARVERCVEALASSAFTVHLQTEGRSVREIVGEIDAAVMGTSARRGGGSRRVAHARARLAATDVTGAPWAAVRTWKK